MAILMNYGEAMNRMTVYMALTGLIVAGLPIMATAQTTLPSTNAATNASASLNDADSVKSISNHLRDADPAVVTQGVDQIRDVLQSNGQKIIGLLRSSWLKRLMELQRFDDVRELALLAILSSPADTPTVEQLQTYRVQAFTGEKRAPEALAAAKQLFNVCTLKGTAEAIRTICQCLNALHPDDRQVLRRYRKEQIDGARPDVGSSSPEPSMLSTIQIDPSPYQAAIRLITAEDYRSLTGEGNLLLLAGNAGDAWDVFERAYTMASDKDLPAASENLARCMKAQDGTIGRANAWVLSIRPQAQIASARSTVGALATTRTSEKE